MASDTKKTAKVAACALCCVVAAVPVAAAPPVGNSSARGLLGRAAGFISAKPSHPTAAPLEMRGLDLRPPEAVGDRMSPLADAAFPSGKHRPVAPGRAEDDLPSLGGGTAVRAESRAEQIARRVQHEGLPIARLWESRSALVHVGLSPRGKPGLWLIQKVP